MATQIGTFDHDNARYKCCCSKCHSTTGVKVVAILHLVLSAVELLAVISGRAGGNAERGGGGLNVVITLACVGCAFYALHSGSAAFLIPYMVLSALGIAGCILFGILFIVGAVLFDSSRLQEMFGKSAGGNENQFGQDTQDSSGAAGSLTAFFFAFGVILFVCGALQLWIILIFVAAYRFLREKAPAGYTSGQPMVAMSARQSYPAQHYAPQGYTTPPPPYGEKEAPPSSGQPTAQPVYAKM